jgi:DNA primase
MVPFVIASAVERHGKTPKGKARIVRDVQPLLSAVRDRVEKSLYVKDLAESIGVRESELVAQMRRAHGPSKDRTRAPRKPPDPHERQIVTMMAHLPEILPLVASLDAVAYFRNEDLKSIALAILEHPEHPVEAIDRVASESGGGDTARMAAEIAVADESWSYMECDRMLHRFVETRRKKSDYRRIDSEIRAAEKARDEERVTRLLAEKQKLAEALEKQKSRYTRQAPGQD